MRKFLSYFCIFLYLSIFFVEAGKVTPRTGRWCPNKANQWYAQYPWLVGCNYLPSNAINQLEMWQGDTFDLKINDKELKMAHELGFNFIRVYLHDLAYKQDPKGFLDRVDKFLNLTDKYKIKVMLVFFDDCWLDYRKIGKQPKPYPGTHNSGWLESPGLTALKKYNSGDENLKQDLETYVKAVLSRFKNDKRVIIWDLYNEPGNSPHYRRDIGGHHGKKGRAPNPSKKLLRDVYIWARQVNPSQPLTTCTWGAALANHAAYHWADILSFHHYGNSRGMRNIINTMKRKKRPIICTEYMGRPASTFQNSLPLMRKENVAAVSWGFVSGKMQTIYGWGTWNKPGKIPEPKVWFHDIYRQDGTPFSQEEINVIKREIRLSKKN